MSGIPMEGDVPATIAPSAPVPPSAPSPGRKEEFDWVGSFAPSIPIGDDAGRPWRLELPSERWKEVTLTLDRALHHRLASFWAEHWTDGASRLHTLWMGDASCRGIHLITVLPAGNAGVPSLLPEIPAALYFEREMREMYGVEFLGAADRRPLLLHYQHSGPPMRPGTSPPRDARAPFAFPITEGEGIYEIPVGPVHAGIIEPGHFRFQVVGEQILNLEVRLGYTHKATEKRFEGRSPSLGVLLAESVSGDSSVAGAVAFLEAVEQALGIEVSRSAQLSRGLLLELERMAFLLGDVAGIALDVGYAAGAAQANFLRERSYEGLEMVGGSRLGRGTLAPGGLARPLASDMGTPLAETLALVARGNEELLEHLLSRPSVVDRLRGTGEVRTDVARALALVGPAARASGLDRDVRRDRPYGAYREVAVRVAGERAGDVEARLKVKVAEIAEACRLASEFQRAGALGSAKAPSSLPARSAGDGLGVVEAPRGEFLIWVSVGEEGTLRRVHVRDPSYLNWPAIEYAVKGNIVPDFPLCNKSLNLSYSGFDR